ncbi:Uncharacterised protein [Enterobacter cloacae]|nr:Uncharacterised protein [Enterobacter cloacae]
MLAQYLLHHLRHRLVLENAALAGAAEQRQTGTEHHLVMRLVSGGGNPLQAGDNVVHRLPAAHPQGGVFHQHLFRGEIVLWGGEVDSPLKWLAQGFIPGEVQCIEFYRAVVNLQMITGLSVKQRQPVAHSENQYLIISWFYINTASVLPV